MKEPPRRASVGSQSRCTAIGVPVPARRSFITRLLRNASLALLGAAGGAAIIKRRKLLREGKCLNRGLCRDCGVFEQCGLPRALSIKSAFARISDGE